MMFKRANDYNVVFSTPSRTDKGSMPLGNGELGANVWATREKLCIYLSRSDALTECDRNVKLGWLTATFVPNILAFPHFRQELILEEGCVCLSLADSEGRQVTLRVFAERERNALRIGIESNFELETRWAYKTWRTEENRHVNDMGFDQTALTGVAESADCQVFEEDYTLIYHENQTSIIPHVAELEALGDCLNEIPDELTGRVFGGILRVQPQYKSGSAGEMITIGMQAEATLFTFSEQPKEGTETYLRKQIRLSRGGKNFLQARAETKDFWKNYFEKSYLYVEGDKPKEIRYSTFYKNLDYEDTSANETDSWVTRAYILSKYMQKCCIGAKYPIRFNGGHFNLGVGIPYGQATMPESIGTETPYPPKLHYSPDERSWGHMLLWQNERLPYYSLLAQGDSEPVRKFLEYYCSFGKINRIKAKKYYGAEGAYNTEIMTSFGLSPNYLYGYDRAGLPDGYVTNRYGGAVDISPGLEQAYFLIAYSEYTSDETFFRETALPYILDLFRYIETRFPLRENGKLIIEPLNSIETYWDTKNPVTVVAGLHAVLERIAAHPLPAKEQKYFREFEKIVPEYTFRQREGQILCPAETYSEERHNVESPEIYAIFPFDNQIERISLSTARRTFAVALSESRNFQGMAQGDSSQAESFCGWHYEGIVAAILNQTDIAKQILEYNCSYRHKNARFPAFWGPAYDSLPDTDHAANIQTQLQYMVMRREGDTIHLLPAFPREWKCCFRLWVDRETFVSCTYEDGQIKTCECNNTKYQLVLDDTKN